MFEFDFTKINQKYWLWIVFGTLAILVFAIELYEHPDPFQNFSRTFFGELLLLESLILIIAITFSYLIRMIAAKTHTLRILEARNNFSQKIVTVQDWQRMTDILVSFPSNILPVQSSALLVAFSQDAPLHPVASWTSDTAHPLPHQHIPNKCSSERPFQLMKIDQSSSEEQHQDADFNCYCMPLIDDGSLHALLHFCFAPDFQPSPEQINLINNLNSSMGIALRAAQGYRLREQLIEENASEKVRAEIASDIHDLLAQNLCYLQLKLDQFSNLPIVPQSAELQTDLPKLQAVASRSYDLVRRMITNLMPESPLGLADLMAEHAYTTGDRSGFDVKFIQEGQPKVLDPRYVGQIYIFFCEAFSNVEKHAGAAHVEAKLTWNDDHLNIRISDDGRGFEPDHIRQKGHYGLTSMRQRIAELHGRLAFDSSPNQGTTILVDIPLDQVAQQQ